MTVRTLAFAIAAASGILVSPVRAADSATLDADDCTVLAALDFAEPVGVAVTLAASVAPAAGDVPARCRVTGTIAPETAFEAWLPLADWNGRLLATGCYNLCGSLRTDQMEDAAARGYATVTMDGGHSDAKYPDSRWAWNNTALEDEFGHRALHLATVLAKELVRAFYGDDSNYAYFRGCSTGGRQGLVAAERYPEDYDGIVAGAPFNQRLSIQHLIWADRANTDASGKPILRGPQFARLHAAVLDTCDAADGQVDGIVGDPERCAFNPATLACATDKPADDCLTPAQVTATARIYAGPVDSAGRALAAFGAMPGSELTWEQQLIGQDGKPPYFRFIGQNWLRFHAFEPDPPPSPGDILFDFDKDPARLAASAARIGYTGELERFAARDGRLIVHHGWSDESLQPAYTLEYWRAAQRMNGGTENLDRFARLFMLPGVQHCGGGPGAGDIDYLTAIERWVEADKAPAMLVGTRTKDSVATLQRQTRFPVPGEILLRRPVFAYPALARYKGEGDPLDPAAYLRERPPARSDR